MGKIKKVVKDDAKKSERHRVLKVKTPGKDTKKTRKNLDAISSKTRKSLKKRKDVDAKLIRPVKRTSATIITTKKSQNSKRKSISTVKKTASNKNQRKLKKEMGMKKKMPRSELKTNKKQPLPKKQTKVGVVTTKNKSDVNFKKAKASMLKKNSNKKQDTDNVIKVSRSKTKQNTKNKVSPKLQKNNVSILTKNNKSADVKGKNSSINKHKENKNTSGIRKIISSNNKLQRFKVNTTLIFKQKDKIDDRVRNLQKNVVTSAINALLNIVKGSKIFFENELSTFLRISCKKTHETPCQTLCIPLKHSLVRETGKVCLIVQTLNNENPEDYHKTIEHYENVLKQNSMTNIKTIMTYYQLRMNYNEFELQRELVELYDVFLVDAKLYDYVLMTLRKIVYDINKLPIPVKLDSDHFKERINSALLKTPTYLYPSIENFTFRIGHLEMTENQIRENVFEACSYLSKKFPGGWNNITDIGIKTANSTPIRIFSMPNDRPKTTALEVKYVVETKEDVQTTEDVMLNKLGSPGSESEVKKNSKEPDDEESEGFAGFAPDPESKVYEGSEVFERQKRKKFKIDEVDVKK